MLQLDKVKFFVFVVRKKMDLKSIINPPQIHQLKPKKNRSGNMTKSYLTPFVEENDQTTNDILSSIHPKLRTKSISISTDSRVSRVFFEKQEPLVSCIDKLTFSGFILHDDSSLEFQEMKRRAFRKGYKTIVKDTCSQLAIGKISPGSKCSIQQIWTKKMIVDERDYQQAQYLKNIAHKISHKYWEQIEKDLNRSFHELLIPKTKLMLFHVNSDRPNIFQNLRTVLRMYCLYDEEIGYFQGMNLLVGNIILHMKEVEKTFFFLREIMGRAGLRVLYRQNFNQVLKESDIFLHQHLKEKMPELYEHLMQGQIESTIFVPFFMSMFGCVTDHRQMHNVINLFIDRGVEFLHQMLLSLLCFLKKRLLESPIEDLILVLSVSALKEIGIPWEEVINLTQCIQIN